MVTMTSHPSKIDAQAALMALGGRKAAEDAGLLQKEDSTTTVPKPEGVRKLANVSLNFPQRLMEMLDNASHEDVIGWLPHGRGFIVHNKGLFEKEVLPKYFAKQSKYSSFIRKLNRWGFTRMSRGPESGAYYHPDFRKGFYQQIRCMSCSSTGKANDFVQQQRAHAAADPTALSGGVVNPSGGLGVDDEAFLRTALLQRQLNLEHQRRFLLQQEVLAGRASDALLLPHNLSSLLQMQQRQQLSTLLGSMSAAPVPTNITPVAPNVEGILALMRQQQQTQRQPNQQLDKASED